MKEATNQKELQSFGWLVGGVCSVIGLWPMLIHGSSVRLWALGVGGILIACGSLLPHLLAPVYKAWMWVGHILAWINTRILLSLVFYGLITPIGMVFRLMGKETIRQGFSEDAPSYRVSRQPRSRSHMKFQF